MDKIKFGTDGWRGVIADQFTVGIASILVSAALPPDVHNARTILLKDH